MASSTAPTTAAGKPAGYVGSARSGTTPISSQCPVVDSFPGPTGLSLPYTTGEAAGATPTNGIIDPNPSRSSALGITGYFLEYHYGPNNTPGSISTVPTIRLPLIQHVGFFGSAFGDANLMTWLGLALVPALTFFLFRTRWGLRLRSVGEKPRAADTVGLPVLRIRYVAVVASGMFAALGGAYLSALSGPSPTT